ncbi:MAG TPA: biotin--[acetyl-CoA-carboxylase] ligase [Myxococcales bacterium]|nr:biotin--[acetyl-CoA-carboxylase] ligase [Myxococcales bacterium]HAN30135.1 biotin--[acetyl-CoA-carboxylase] ligase [Myxococcales bacterium]
MNIEQLSALLHPAITELRCYAECPSTNDAIKSIAQGLKLGQWALVTTNRQTQGRGRRGSQWVSESGESLTWSLATRLALPAQVWPRASIVVGGAIVNELGQGDLRLKWPNDLLYCADDERPRKVAGILCERHEPPSGEPIWITGVGMNLSRPQYPEQIREISAGLHEVLPHQNPTERLAALSNAIVTRVDRWTAQRGRLLVQSYDAWLAYRDSAVRLEMAPNQKLVAWLDGLHDDGQLRIRKLDPAGRPMGEIQLVEPWRLLGAKVEPSWHTPAASN